MERGKRSESKRMEVSSAAKCLPAARASITSKGRHGSRVVQGEPECGEVVFQCRLLLNCFIPVKSWQTYHCDLKGICNVTDECFRVGGTLLISIGELLSFTQSFTHGTEE